MSFAALSRALIVHQTANVTPPPENGDRMAALLTLALITHEKALKVALRGVMLASPLERKSTVAQFAGILHTPAAFLAGRLIDLAPDRDRATLREHLL